MKLAFSTLGCPEWSFEQIMDYAKSDGFDAIEVRGIQQTMDSAKLPPFLPENAAHTLRELEARNLKLCMLGTSICMHNREEPEARRKEGREAIDICNRMGIPMMRVFGNDVDDTPDGGVGYVAEGLHELCAEAGKAGVTVALEVHGTYNTIEVFERLLELAPKEHFGILWDIEHSDRTYGPDYMPFYRTIKDRIVHVHVKDYSRPLVQEGLCLVGEGDIPIAPILAQLQQDGYDGYLSFEWEKRWHKDLPAPEIAFPAYARWMRQHMPL